MRIAVVVMVVAVVAAAQLTGCSFNPPPDNPGDGPVRACGADSECDSNVCLEDGQCANPSNVYYVTHTRRQRQRGLRHPG